jgi:hypothetical protein
MEKEGSITMTQDETRNSIRCPAAKIRTRVDTDEHKKKL